MRDHRKIAAWARGRALVVSIYELSRAFPPAERFGLGRELRRTAVSIVSNIAEGAGRSTNKAYANHLDIAAASCSELEAQLDLAGAVGLLADNSTAALIDEVREIRRMVFVLANRVRSPS
jgi:four helix bundle protein